MKSSILPSLYLFLLITYDISMTNYRICYDLNILKPDFKISYQFNITIKIFYAITNLYKSIYKKTFLRN